jgi:hypothetical protein
VAGRRIDSSRKEARFFSLDDAKGGERRDEKEKAFKGEERVKRRVGRLATNHESVITISLASLPAHSRV